MFILYSQIQDSVSFLHGYVTLWLTINDLFLNGKNINRTLLGNIEFILNVFWKKSIFVSY